MVKSYCGVGDLPKDSEWGTARQCFEKGQLRLWGLNEVKSLERLQSGRSKKRKTGSLQDEQLRLRELVTAGKVLVRKFGEAKKLLALNDDLIDKGQKPIAKAELDKARRLIASAEKKRAKIIKDLNEQKKIVDSLSKPQKKVSKSKSKKRSRK